MHTRKETQTQRQAKSVRLSSYIKKLYPAWKVTLKIQLKPFDVSDTEYKVVTYAKNPKEAADKARIMFELFHRVSENNIPPSRMYPCVSNMHDVEVIGISDKDFSEILMATQPKRFVGADKWHVTGFPTSGEVQLGHEVKILKGESEQWD